MARKAKNIIIYGKNSSKKIKNKFLSKRERNLENCSEKNNAIIKNCPERGSNHTRGTCYTLAAFFRSRRRFPRSLINSLAS